MHHVAVAFLLAIIVAARFATPGTVHAADDAGDWYDDPIADADVVLIGQAHDVRAGRVVNGCQYTAATVQVEEVILGELPTSAPPDLTVEFVGDCATVGTLGGSVPAERAVWFLINKGNWLRDHVTSQSGDWSAEDAYWRPLEPDAIAVDQAGALGKHGEGPNWLPGGTFETLVDEVRDSAYLRSGRDAAVTPVGLGFWFSAEAYLAAAALFVVALAAAVWAWIVRGRSRRVGLVVAGVAFVGACLAVAGGPRLARTVDFAGGIHGRTAVVEALQAGSLERGEYDDYALPRRLEGLARDGVVQATPGPPTMAFFLTQVFFSPDPYCGYEYAQVPEALVLDPLGSGWGLGEDLGDGWYWVCAS